MRIPASLWKVIRSPIIPLSHIWLNNRVHNGPFSENGPRIFWMLCLISACQLCRSANLVGSGAQFFISSAFAFIFSRMIDSLSNVLCGGKQKPGNAPGKGVKVGDWSRTWPGVGVGGLLYSTGYGSGSRSNTGSITGEPSPSSSSQRLSQP